MYNEFKPKDMSGKLRVGYVGPGASWGRGGGRCVLELIVLRLLYDYTGTDEYANKWEGLLPTEEGRTEEREGLITSIPVTKISQWYING